MYCILGVTIPPPKILLTVAGMNAIDTRTFKQQTQCELRKQIFLLREKGLCNHTISEIDALCKIPVSTICKKTSEAVLLFMLIATKC